MAAPAAEIDALIEDVVAEAKHVQRRAKLLVQLAARLAERSGTTERSQEDASNDRTGRE